MLGSLIQAGRMLGQTPFLRGALPVLAVAGPGLLFYFGLCGIVGRATYLLGNADGGVGFRLAEITGDAAMVVGSIYLASALLSLAILAPVAWGAFFAPPIP